MLDSTGLNRFRLPAKLCLETASSAAGAVLLHFSFFSAYVIYDRNTENQAVGRQALIRSVI